MTGKRMLPLLYTLALALAATGTLFAAGAPVPAVAPPAVVGVEPEAAPPVQELEALLFGQAAPQASVEPQAASAAAPATDTGWWYGICWTSCWYCTSDADCPWGERCRFNVQCP